MSSSALETEIQRRLWERDPERYLADCLKIRDKHGKIVPLEANAHQRKVLDEYKRQRERGIPVRIAILKPRQTGNSTVSQGLIYHQNRFHPADAKVVAHDADTTELLFRMAHRFYDNSPSYEQLPTEAYHRKGLVFAPPHGGSITIATAGTKTVGRGSTPLYLHCSETAHYQDAKIVMASLLNAVPKTAESLVIVETTANGMGGYFWTLWHKAKAGQSEFVPIFLSWKDFPEYSLRVPHPEGFEASLSGYERALRAKHNLTLEQLNWRRSTIQTELNGDEDLFKQEYPLDDIEAFLTSGRARFDRPLVMEWPIEDPLRGHLQLEDRYGSEILTFIPNREGYLSIFRKPQPGRKYVIGSDVAEGIEIDGAPTDNRYDKSSGDVIDRHTGEQVAHLHGHFEPDEFGRQLALLGRYYNNAFQGV